MGRIYTIAPGVCTPVLLPCSSRADGNHVVSRGWGRLQRGADAVYRRVRGAGQRSPRRRLGWLSAVVGSRLPAQDSRSEGKEQNSFGVDAASSSGGLLAETLVAGNAPGRSEHGAPGRLPRRVHLSIQPAQIAQPGQTLLPSARTSGCCRDGRVQISGQMRRQAGFLKPQPIGETGVGETLHKRNRTRWIPHAAAIAVRQRFTGFWGTRPRRVSSSMSQ